MSYDCPTPDDHVFVPVRAQTGCKRCGYATGHHPTAAMLRQWRTDNETPIRALTSDELAALRAYADRHGRTWKAALQQLRNDTGFGPAGLMAFRLDVAIRAHEEVAEAGSVAAAVAAVRAQIAHPVNRAHRAFMVRVLATFTSTAVKSAGVRA